MAPPTINDTLLGMPGVLGVYNATRGFLGVGNTTENVTCDLFRSAASEDFFMVWPEKMYNLTYCCEDATDHKYNLANFTYEYSEATITSRPYYDLGYVDFRLSPYWKQWRFFAVPQRKIALQYSCEFTDLHHVYMQRFWTKVVGEGTLLAFKIILLMHLAVVLFVLLKWVWTTFFTKGGQKKSLFKVAYEDLRKWHKNRLDGVEDWLSDMLHIYLIVLMGGALIEGVGHSSLIRWRAIILYNAAVVYSHLTYLCVVSTILRQMVTFHKEVDDKMEMQKNLKITNEKLRNVGFNDGDSNYNSVAMMLTMLQAREPARDILLQLTDDWRWQRVFGQVAVLILIGIYLMFVDDDTGSSMDNIAALLLAALVVACMWSGGVAVVIMFRILMLITGDVVGYLRSGLEYIGCLKKKKKLEKESSSVHDEPIATC